MIAGLMNGLRRMSKGRKKSWQPTGLERMQQSKRAKQGIKDEPKKKKVKVPPPIFIKRGWDRGVLTFQDGGYMGISRVFMDEFGTINSGNEQPKDTRTESEKWADDWARKNGGSNLPANTKTANT